MLSYEDSPGLAAKRFRAQLDENPKSDIARYGLAIAQIKGSQLNEARENLKLLLAKSPNEIIYNLAQIELDISSGRLPDAVQRTDRMLAQYPGNYPLRQLQVDLLGKQNKPAEAEKVPLICSRPVRRPGHLVPDRRNPWPVRQHHRPAPGTGRILCTGR